MGESVSSQVTAFTEAVVAPDETLYERRMRALMFRNAGATFREIASKNGVSPAQARKDVTAALREVLSETAEDMIARQRAVLLDIRRANYQAMVGGDVDAARVILSTLERESKLFGLDAPTRVNVGVSDTDFAERTAALIESMGLEPPRELAVMQGVRAGGSEVVEGDVVEVEAVDDQAAVPSDCTGVDGAVDGPDVGDEDEDSKLSGPSEAWSNL